MDNPLISVIVPTYKREPSIINRSISSILKQTYKNFELIIIDDSPKNYSFRNQVENYVLNLKDTRIKYIKHESNKGANVARNTGIKNASGEYIAFLDDDDEWLPTKLEKQISKFSKKTPGLVYCKAIIINQETNKVKPVLNELHTGKQYKKLLRQNFIGSNSFVMIPMHVFHNIGLYDESLPSHQDYDLFLRIAKHYEIDYVDDILVKYYIHRGERISTNSKKLYQGREALYNKFLPDIQNDKELSKIWELKKIPLYFKNGKKKKSILLLLKVMIKNPLFFTKYLNGTLKYLRLSKITISE